MTPEANALRGMETTITLCRKFFGGQTFGLGVVPPTLTRGRDAGCRVCGSIVTGVLTAVDVLALDENEMATLGIFLEPQLPMTHLRLCGRFQEHNQRPGE